MIDLSVVIPAYNEESRLLSTLESVWRFLSEYGCTFEIIVVNDGSKDGTAQLVQEFAKHHDNVRLISYDINKGKGYAVKAGVLAAFGNFILLDDADGSSPIDEVVRLKEAILNGADIAIGSRAKPDPSRTVKALAYRTYMGVTFNCIVQSLLLPGLYDTQCGFKLFKQEVAKNVFSASRINGYGFDVEILTIDKGKHYKIEEIAINWTNVAGSKINMFCDSAKMLTEVLKIRWFSQLGIYR